MLLEMGCGTEQLVEMGMGVKDEELRYGIGGMKGMLF